MPNHINILKAEQERFAQTSAADIARGRYDFRHPDFSIDGNGAWDASMSPDDVDAIAVFYGKQLMRSWLDLGRSWEAVGKAHRLTTAVACKAAQIATRTADPARPSIDGWDKRGTLDTDELANLFRSLI